MSDAPKRKGKRKSVASGHDEVADARKLTPDEEAVAKALLWELPSREGKLAGMKVRIFLADEAVDFLLKSRFASPPPNDKSKEPVVKDAKSAAQLLGCLLDKGLFQRAMKLQKEKRAKPVAKPPPPPPAATEQPQSQEGAAREKRERKQKEREEKRRRGRPRLDIHEAQEFVLQPGEVYIWHYDPTRPRNVALGFLLVLGSILLCLFPMWPLELRTGTYYLSVGALCLLGSLIGLALMRFPLFGLVWCLSLGRLHFWFLPNLTEDVGVLESFLPVVNYSWSAGGGGLHAAALPAATGDKKTD